MNAYLASTNWTYKTVTEEDTARNTPELKKEHMMFAQKMFQQGLERFESTSIIYWDITYFETCIVARRARAKREAPAVVEKPHRGVYFKKNERVKKRKRKLIEQGLIEPPAGVLFTDSEPVNLNGGNANSLALCATISKDSVVLARSQF